MSGMWTVSHCCCVQCRGMCFSCGGGGQVAAVRLCLGLFFSPCLPPSGCFFWTMCYKILLAGEQRSLTVMCVHAVVWRECVTRDAD